MPSQAQVRRKMPGVQLVVGILYRKRKILDAVVRLLESKYGLIRDSIDYPFNFTNYYTEEMGTDLHKSLVVFSGKIGREGLPILKRYAISIEKKFLDLADGKAEARRQANIDPGYMSLHNVVLASTKELPHRPYLGDGIFADVVLEFRHGRFCENVHTFPDFRSDIVKNFLAKNRTNASED